jgi:SnoaL-like domain
VRNAERDTLSYLSDRQEIFDLVCRYCRAIDRLDLPSVRSVYTYDGVDHHTGFSGPADEYVSFLSTVLPRHDGTQHIIGNHLTEIHGDEAVAETYGTAVHWGSPPDDPDLNFTSGFRMVDHLVRRNGSWLILERWAVREWTRSDAGRRRAPEGEGPRGSRGPDDPLSVLLRRFRAAGSAV